MFQTWIAFIVKKMGKYDNIGTLIFAMVLVVEPKCKFRHLNYETIRCPKIQACLLGDLEPGLQVRCLLLEAGDVRPQLAPVVRQVLVAVEELLVDVHHPLDGEELLPDLVRALGAGSPQVWSHQVSKRVADF